MNKSVEITVLIELFSTFFEKISSGHSKKDEFQKNLTQFKKQLYDSQNDDIQQQQNQNLSETPKQQLKEPKTPNIQQNIKTESNTHEKSFNSSNLLNNFTLNSNKHQHHLIKTDTMKDLTNLINKQEFTQKYPYARNFTQQQGSCYRNIGFCFFQEQFKKHSQPQIPDNNQYNDNKQVLQQITQLNSSLNLFKTIINDNSFDALFIQLIKSYLVDFLTKINQNYLDFLFKTHETGFQQIKDQINSNKEPNEIILKLLSHCFQINIQILQLDYNQMSVRKYQTNQQSDSEIYLLKIFNFYQQILIKNDEEKKLNPISPRIQTQNYQIRNNIEQLNLKKRSVDLIKTFNIMQLNSDSLAQKLANFEDTLETGVQTNLKLFDSISKNYKQEKDQPLCQININQITNIQNNSQINNIQNSQVRNQFNQFSFNQHINLKDINSNNEERTNKYKIN